jgi:hypothetical protein
MNKASSCCVKFLFSRSTKNGDASVLAVGIQPESMLEWSVDILARYGSHVGLVISIYTFYKQ